MGLGSEPGWRVASPNLQRGGTHTLLGGQRYRLQKKKKSTDIGFLWGNGVQKSLSGSTILTSLTSLPLTLVSKIRAYTFCLNIQVILIGHTTASVATHSF